MKIYGETQLIYYKQITIVTFCKRAYLQLPSKKNPIGKRAPAYFLRSIT